MLRSPNNSKSFQSYLDTNNVQLGVVVREDVLPIIYYSREFTPAQSRYLTWEQDILSIIETFEEYTNILLYLESHIHTGHKNILSNNNYRICVHFWRLIGE